MASRLVVEVISDASKFSRGLNDAERRLGGFASQARQADSTFGRLNGRFEATGSALKQVAAVVGTVQLARLAKGAVDAASALGESANAVQVTFGSASQKLIEFGKTAATQVGLSAREVNELATPLGAILTNFGFAAAEAADETIELTERAADMASVFNVDVSEALIAIQAGLRGESEPLRRFGVSLSAAAVESKALALGLAASKKELTDQDKVTARLALIYEQTAKTAGDFLNTSDSLANQQRILKAEVENLSAELGAVLLPVAEDVVGIVREAVDWFSSLSDETQENIIKWGLLAAAAVPVISVLGKMITAYKNLRLAILGANAAAAAGVGVGAAGGAARGAAGGIGRGAAAGAAAGAALQRGSAAAATSSSIQALRASALTATSGPAASLPTVAGAVVAWDLGAKAGNLLADALGLAEREVGEFTDGLIIPGGIKETLNDWFGWFEGSRVEGAALDERAWSEQRAATWATNQAARATTDAAMSTFLMSERQSEATITTRQAAEAASAQATAAFLASEHLGDAAFAADDFTGDVEQAAWAAQEAADHLAYFTSQSQTAAASMELIANLKQPLAEFGPVIQGVLSGAVSAGEFLRAWQQREFFGITDPSPPGSITSTPPVGVSVTPQQHGGPVSAGQLYLVGEVGPELFAPSRNGTIIPNSQIGSTNVTNHFTVNNPQTQDLESDLQLMSLLSSFVGAS